MRGQKRTERRAHEKALDSTRAKRKAPTKPRPAKPRAKAATKPANGHPIYPIAGGKAPRRRP